MEMRGHVTLRYSFTGSLSTFRGGLGTRQDLLGRGGSMASRFLSFPLFFLLELPL